MACAEEDTTVNSDKQPVVEVSSVLEVETQMEMVNEDYTGERSSYYYDWNGSYYNEFDQNPTYESIKEDGTSIYWSVDRSGTFFYYEGDVTTTDTYFYDDRIPNQADLAVIDGTVYASAVSSTFEEDRKLYVYQLVGETLVAKDSVLLDIEGGVEPFSMEGINGELLISVVQNSLKSYDKSNLRHVYRYKDGKLAHLKSYPSATDGPVIKVFPFQGAYLEYNRENRTISKLDDAGNTTIVLDGSDLDTEEKSIGWKRLHFSDDMLIIDIDYLTSTVTPQNSALLYDGQKLYKVFIPVVLTSGGHPIHTMFQDGAKFIHYNTSNKQLDVYFRGSSSIDYMPEPRVYHYQLVL